MLIGALAVQPDKKIATNSTSRSIYPKFALNQDNLATLDHTFDTKKKPTPKPNHTKLKNTRFGLNIIQKASTKQAQTQTT